MFKFHSINAQIVSNQEAKLDATDIGFRRGYAAFDYLKIHKSQAIFIEDHLERFENSAKTLRLTMPMSRQALKQHVLELIEKNNATEAGLQLFLTGGIAADGFTPAEPQLVILVTKLPKPKAEAYDTGLKLITHEYVRTLPEVKSNNYFMAVYLSKAMQEANATDVLYHDAKRVLETTRSNVFIVKEDNSIVTAHKDVLPGITRKQLLKLIPKLTKLELRDVALEELWSAKEIFISSTTKGAMPITQIDDKVIADGKVGPLTKALGKAFQEHLENYMSTLV